jgi:hypothetical protein
VNLRIGDRDLESPTGHEAHEYLIANPLACRSVCIHGVEQTCPDGFQGTADEPEQRDNADLGQRKALHDGGDGERDDEREHPDSGSDGTGVVDALEVDREVVEQCEVCSSEKEHKHRAHPDVALHNLRAKFKSATCRTIFAETLTYQPLDNHRTFLLIDLPGNEYCHDGDESDQQSDHLAALPRMGLPAVLQSQHVRHDQAHHQSSSDEVHL